MAHGRERPPQAWAKVRRAWGKVMGRLLLGMERRQAWGKVKQCLSSNSSSRRRRRGVATRQAVGAESA
jgi:hypothetical protein